MQIDLDSRGRQVRQLALSVFLLTAVTPAFASDWIQIPGFNSVYVDMASARTDTYPKAGGIKSYRVDHAIKHRHGSEQFRSSGPEQRGQ